MTDEKENKEIKEEKLERKKECNDKSCSVHGNLKTRGKIFRGKVIRKFSKRIVIEFERMVYISKYERYQKKKTKIHARLPLCMEDDVKIGDYAEIKECRPLSKLVHFVFIKNMGGEK